MFILLKIMSVLSKREISQGIENRNIVIHPFNPDNLNTCSYDVTLGIYFYRMNLSTKTETFYNPYCKGDVEKKWTGFHKADPVKTLQQFGMSFSPGDNLNSETDKAILLRPGESILANTQEFIGALNHHATFMTAHNDVALNFINIAGKWGDSNYVDRWSLHITNLSQYNIPLICGKRIATISFFKTQNETLLNDMDFDLNDVIQTWKPSNLLPTTYIAPKSELPKPETVGGIEIPKETQTYKQQQVEQQQQITQQQQQHKERISKKSAKSFQLPKPPYDQKGNPIRTPFLPSIETKQKYAVEIPENALKYDASKL